MFILMFTMTNRLQNKWKIVDTNNFKTNTSSFNTQNRNVIEVFSNPSKNNISIKGISYGEKIIVYTLLGELITSKMTKDK